MRALILFALLLLGATAAPAAPKAPPTSDDIALLETLRAADLRVAGVGERLALGNVALCQRTEYRTGLLLHDLSQYAAGLQEAARQNFGLGAGVGIEGVVPGSPAARAGITADSILVSVDGQAVRGGAGSGDFTHVGAVLDRIDRAVAGGTLTLETQPRGKAAQKAIIQAIKGCATRFQIVLGNSVNAAADGHYVQIEGRMVDFVCDDQELAAVIAHELAHNILDHRARLDAVGANRGLLGSIGKSAALIRATENEADRLSVYLMANAGYDPKAATAFWDRLTKKTGMGFLSDSTHLRRKPRVALFMKELEALDALRARTPAGQPLIPDFARPPFAPLR